jgi:hypothetical protein
MKKISGWLLIVFCSLLLLVFLISISLVLFGEKTTTQTPSEKLTILLSFLFPMALFVYGLINGIKMVKKEKSIELVEFKERLDITVSGQIDYKDYRRLFFYLSYKKRILWFCVIILLALITSLLTNKNVSFYNRDTLISLCIFLGLFILVPIILLIKVKKIYETNTVFKYSMSYHITNEFIQIKSETMDTTQKWGNFYGAMETKKFFLLYQGKMIATLIDKKMFSDLETEKFRMFLKSLPLKKM